MITDTERARIRDMAREAVTTAPAPAGAQLATLTVLLGPPTAEAAAQRKTAEQDAARGAA